eukprot:INCI5146.12.p1 GENE.INCI5146.12~~INCI5146.12.p1  ORF type:complete len:677 (+),score=136.13 INCI5146.12:249-2279(+)
MPSSRTRVRHSRGRTNSPAAAAAAATSIGGVEPGSREKRFAKKFVPPASPPRPSRPSSSKQRHQRPQQSQTHTRGSHALLERRHSTDPQSSSLAVERAQARAAAALGQRPSLRGVKALEAAETMSAGSKQSRSPPSFRSSAVGSSVADGDSEGRDNFVDLVGFRTRCRDLDLQLAPEEEREVFQELDRDGSGFVDFGDFIHGVAKKTSGVQARFRQSLRERKLAERHARLRANAQAVELARRGGQSGQDGVAGTSPRSKYLQLIDHHRQQNDTKTEITEREIKQTVLKLAEKARSKFKSMSDMFKKFDVNRDGSLSFDDFNAALKKYDFARFIEPEKAYATFASLDANKDDHISFREFMQVFNTHLAVEESGLATSVAPPESGSRKAGATAVQVSKRARSLAESSRLQRVKDKLRSRISDLASADSLNNKRESQTLMEAFRKFDGDASGSIDFRELSQVNKRLNLGLRPAELKMVFQSMDADDSGSIDVKEFLNSMRSEDYAANYNPLQVGRQRMIGALKDRSQSNGAKAAVDMSTFRESRWASDTHHVIAADPVDDPTHPLSSGYNKRMYATWRSGKITEKYGRPSTQHSDTSAAERPSTVGRLNFRAFLQQKQTSPRAVLDPTAELAHVESYGLAKRDQKEERARLARAAKLEKRLNDQRQATILSDFKVRANN